MADAERDGLPGLDKKRPTPLLGVGPRTLGEMPISF